MLNPISPMSNSWNKWKISSYQTGRFPVTSIRVCKYIRVLHDCDSNAILANHLKSHAYSELLQALTALYKHMTYRGLQPCLHILYNECSVVMKHFIRMAVAQHQLVPPGLTCSLIVERSIQTFKHHLISGLSSYDTNFPLHLWCLLIRQAVLTLNLLCVDILNPCLSAKSFLNGALDFNQTLLAPPDSKSIFFRGWVTNTLSLGMEWRYGTFSLPPSTNDAIWCMSPKLAMREWQK